MKINKNTRAYLRYWRSLWKRHKLLTAANLALNVILFSYAAANTLCIRDILNGFTGVPGQALRHALPGLIGMIIAALIRFAAIRGCALLDAKRAYYYQNQTRLSAMKRALRQTNAARVSGEASRYFEVLDDDAPAMTFPPELLTEVGGFCIYTLISLGILLSINRTVTLFLLIPLSVALWGVSRLSQNMKRRRSQNRDAHDTASAFLGDVIEAAADIRMAGAEEAVLRRHDRVYTDRLDTAMRDTVFNERVLALLHGSVYIGTALIMLIGARLMAGDALGLGDFSMFVAHLGTLSNCIERVTELFVNAKHAEVSYERMVETLCEGDAAALTEEVSITFAPFEEDAPSPVREPLKAFEAHGLCCERDNEAVFQDVNFKALPGQLVVVRGGIASGKSTLVSVLTGVLPPSRGEVLYNGRPVSEETRPYGVAGAVQSGGFFADGIDANLRLQQHVEDRDMETALDVSALKPVVTEHGMEASIGERGSRLSGGQLQRLALARVLSRASGVAVLDDCVSALDADTRERVLAALRTYLRRTRRVAVIATNDARFTEAADVTVSMNAGAPPNVQYGSPDATA